MIVAPRIRGLNARDALVPPGLVFSRQLIFGALAQSLKFPVRVTSDAGHLDVFASLPVSKKGVFSLVSHVRQDDVAPPQIGMFVKLGFERRERRNTIEPNNVPHLGLRGVILRDRQCRGRQREHIVRKLGVEYEDGLAWDAQRQLHAGEYNQLIAIVEGRTVRLRFFDRRLPNER